MNIYPSLISSDLLNIQQTLKSFENKCTAYHLDVMDDHFVPNITWGPAFINAIRTATTLPLHVHLMVENPYMWIGRLKLAPGDTVIFHYEAVKDAEAQRLFIDAAHERSYQAGIAISPNTPAEVLSETIALVDMVLLMTVYPGFSGQTFIPDVLEKINPIAKMQQKCGKNVTLCLDGGINEETIDMVRRHNVQHVAAATAIFGKPDPIAALQQLNKLASAK